jgi:CheY-like chemotaxis protein
MINPECKGLDSPKGDAGIPQSAPGTPSGTFHFMSEISSRPLVLLVEDSEDDAFFFRWSLEKCGLDCDLVHVADGAAALHQLEKVVSGEARRPDLVFLDLKLPAFSGFEVLEWIRRHPLRPALDIAVLSGSEHQVDVDRAKALGASAYYVKPVSGEKLRARFASWHARQTSQEPSGMVAVAAPAGHATLT